MATKAGRSRTSLPIGAGRSCESQKTEGSCLRSFYLSASNYLDKSASASKTFSAWPAARTLFQRLATLPSGSIKSVVRLMPIVFRPYECFSPKMPYSLSTDLSSSLSKITRKVCLSAKLFCFSILSALIPQTTALSFLKSFTRPVNARASLVQPLVLAFG